VNSYRQALSKLKETLGDSKVFDDPKILYAYSFDASGLSSGRPFCVVRAFSREDVVATLKVAHKYSIPVTVRGSGTSLTGASIPSENSIVLDLSPMNKIIEVNVVDGYVVVEPGVRLDDLNSELAKYGYFVPPDPASSSTCSVGGCVAEDAGGMRGAKYGTFRNWVLALEVVLPDGETVFLGEPVMKCRQGLSLLHLMIGSEGLLGVITKIYLKIWPLPEKIVRLLALFNRVEDAGRVVAETRRNGIIPLIMEFLDRNVLKFVREATGLNLPEAEAAIIADVDGPSEAVWRYAEKLKKMMERCGAFYVKASDDPSEMEKLYTARRAAYPACLKLRPMPAVLIEDITVPPSKIPEMLKSIYIIAEKYSVPVVVFGHIGDGNLHPVIYTDPRKPDLWSRAEKCFEEICLAAVRLGGTIAGEHGIGLVKRKVLVKELEERKSLKALELMKKIKYVFDSKGIMNPGKVFL